MGVRREGRNSLRPPRMGNGRDALGPLRPCGFASLRQPDACGAGESCASVGPTPFSVERELDPPVQCAAVGDNRPPANESMPKWSNAIANRKS